MIKQREIYVNLESIKMKPQSLVKYLAVMILVSAKFNYAIQLENFA